MNRLKVYTEKWAPADYCIAVLLLSFPAYNRIMPPLIILWAFTLIFKRNSFIEVKSAFNWRNPGVWFVLFFVAHLLGLSITENYKYAFDDLGMKSSFLILPVLVAVSKSKLNFKQVIDLFLVGLFAACTIAYSYAVFRSIYNAEDNQWAYFTESYLSFTMHRSYFATYLAIGTLIAVNRVFTTKRALYIILSFIFTVTTILTFSKAGILLLFVALTIALIMLSSKYYSWKLGLGLSTIVILLLAGAFLFSNTLQVRFNKMIEGATTVKTINNPTVESSASRAIMWSTSMKLIKENPILGVGTGDVSDELDKKNLELGNTGVAESSLNSHNQYLNTGVQLGLIGMIPLLMIFIVSFLQAYRINSFELIVLGLMLFTTLLFESFLETQAGIIPVTLLLLLFSKKSLQNETPHTDAILSA